MDHEADAGGVDAHAEGGCGYYDIEASGYGLGGLEVGGLAWVDESFLHALAGGGVEAGMVGGCGYVVGG